MATEVFNDGGNSTVPPAVDSPIRNVGGQATDKETLDAQQRADQEAFFNVRNALILNDEETSNREADKITDPTVRQEALTLISQANLPGAPSDYAAGRLGSFGAVGDIRQLFFMMVVYLESFTSQFSWDEILKTANAQRQSNPFRNLNEVNAREFQGFNGGTPEVDSAGDTGEGGERGPAAARRQLEEEEQRARDEFQEKETVARDELNGGEGSGKGSSTSISWPVQNLPTIEGGLSKSVNFGDGKSGSTFAEPVIAVNEGAGAIELNLEFVYAVGVGDIPGFVDGEPTSYESREAKQTSAQAGAGKAELVSSADETQAIGRSNLRDQEYADRGLETSATQQPTGAGQADATATPAVPGGSVNPAQTRGTLFGTGRLLEGADANDDGVVEGTSLGAASFLTGVTVPGGGVEEQNPNFTGRGAPPLGLEPNAGNTNPWTVEEVMGMIYLAISLVYPFNSTPLVNSGGDDKKDNDAQQGTGQFPVLFLRHYSLFPFLTPFVCTQVQIEPDENSPLIVTNPVNLKTGTENHLEIPAVRQQVRIVLTLRSAHNYLPFFKKDDDEQIKIQTSGKTYLGLANTLAKGRINA